MHIHKGVSKTIEIVTSEEAEILRSRLASKSGNEEIKKILDFLTPEQTRDLFNLLINSEEFSGNEFEKQLALFATKCGL